MQPLSALAMPIRASILSLRLHPYNLIRWLEVSLDAARRLNKPAQECAILTNMGNSYFDLGEARKAIEFYEQALVISREIGDREAKEPTWATWGVPTSPG